MGTIPVQKRPSRREKLKKVAPKDETQPNDAPNEKCPKDAVE